MSASLSDVLKAQGAAGVEALRKAVSKVDATQKTKNSIRFESSGDRLIFYGRAFIDLLNKGRRPTTKEPSPEMIENLTDYAKARGMDKPESAAWAIAKIINKLGDKTHRRGGRDIYDSAVKKITENITNSVANFKIQEARKQVSESLKGIE